MTEPARPKTPPSPTPAPTPREAPAKSARAPGHGSAPAPPVVPTTQVGAVLAKVTPVDLLMGLAVLALLATLLLPFVWSAQLARNEKAAIEFCREIHRIETQFKAKQAKSGGRAQFAASFFELAAAGVYTGAQAEGGILSRQGYLFRIGTLDGGRYFALAHPAQPGETGHRSFYVDDTGVVRESPVQVVGPGFPEAR